MGGGRNEVTDAEYVARAEALAPKLRERSEATNALGQVPREIIDEMLADGLFTLLQPKRFGGTERGLVPLLDCVTAIGSGCGSVGWVFSVVSIHQFHLGLFGLAAQEDVWGPDPNALLASSYMPGGNARAVGDGYRIAGHWKFSSGCDNAQWFILGGTVDGGDGKPLVFEQPVEDAPGKGAVRAAALQGQLDRLPCFHPTLRGSNARQYVRQVQTRQPDGALVGGGSCPLDGLHRGGWPNSGIGRMSQ